jgi:hypothetical protein
MPYSCSLLSPLLRSQSVLATCSLPLLTCSGSWCICALHLDTFQLEVSNIPYRAVATYKGIALARLFAILPPERH